MKAKIDLEKFICSYIKWNNIQDALKDQGLKCCNGKIVKVSQENEDKQKFCEGDWIISKYMHLVMQILNNDNGFYKTFETDGTERNDSYDFIERNFKLWTIADAKPGDVLLSKHNQPFIYNGIFDEESVGAYCGIDKLGNDFLKDTFSCDWSYKEGVKPATKKQRDFLFTKMKEAGWKWDETKKELKKIEQLELTEFEDAVKDMMNAYRDAIGDNDVTTEEVKKHATYLLSLIPHKPIEWSEEDENMLKSIIATCELAEQDRDSSPARHLFEMQTNWLKSVKDRVQPQNKWKPSKKQIVALRWILNNIPYNKHKEEISGLLDQIKDL